MMFLFAVSLAVLGIFCKYANPVFANLLLLPLLGMERKEQCLICEHILSFGRMPSILLCWFSEINICNKSNKKLMFNSELFKYESVRLILHKHHASCRLHEAISVGLR